MTMINLEGKIALVTGASRGIGKACAEILLASGAHVIAVARGEEELKQLYRNNSAVEIWINDVSDDSFYEKVEQLEVLDILVNNVGTNKPQAFIDVDSETLDSMLNINVRSAFLTSQAAVRTMRKSKASGSIINISSQMGHVGSANRTVYCMTKHAIEGMTKAMAVELAEQGIRVNSVAPTFIETPLTKPMLDNDEFKRFVLNKIPMKKIGQPSDIAGAVLYLASNLSQLVTGTSLKVDGGWTAE